MWSVLEQGMQHENPEIREEAENIIHLLGSKDYLEYRELLKQKRTFKGGL